MEEFIRYLVIIKELDYVRLLKLQIILSISFNKACKVLRTTQDLGLVEKSEEKHGFKVNKSKIEDLLQNGSATPKVIRIILENKKPL